DLVATDQVSELSLVHLSRVHRHVPFLRAKGDEWQRTLPAMVPGNGGSARDPDYELSVAAAPPASARALICAMARLSETCLGSGMIAARASAIATVRSAIGSAPSKVGLARPSMTACQSARPWR